ncbi:MAG: NADH-quinone oxidoreductase subunit M [Acidimicrobiales bacterium]|jgi:NADH-quinone oxidoreductase subunit M|nr:NADH-quinone oxidoreductase subunit M [Acidimicrobiales bacterium]MDP6287142.1 NADH-quinone oxidoreductase subunit M [Acidimicrobiales bacterium]MDP6911649.1 NADH-quinone oxidoreductase subunit M [Acidimicrobiales bacterium]HJM72934.1 NADH-quinone oxidoreductase subunit M [Acidimicrobiales bacterium]HJP24329.1 NADH-quinone oxidoreductase subunit M [Acidimicrobiales bacterium]
MGALLTFVVASSPGVPFAVLPALIVVPAVGALLVVCLPRRRPELLKLVAVATSVIVGGMSVWLLKGFDATHGAEMQFTSQADWISDLGIQWLLGIDGISLFLIVLTGVLFPIALLAVDPGHDDRAYYAWLLVLEAGVMGVFCALDLVVFFLCFEVVLVPMYFLIGRWGHGNRAYAATKFFLYTMAGSALMLVGILAVAFLHADATGTSVTFDLVAIAEAQAIDTNAARWIFAAFALAFAVKVPIFPLHTWLPDAHTEAPTAGSVILAGVLLKLGTYGFLRFGLYLFPEASHFFAPVFLTLGVVGIIYGAVVATMQRDLKRLVAYSSVAHLGFIVLGTFALNTEGIEGGLLQMVNHGVSTSALFLLVGMIYERRHTRQIDELGGLQKSAPVMAAVFTLVMLSSIGLPGLNGFVGEFLVLVGAFNAHRWWAVVAAGGVVLAALYLLWAYQRVFHGPAKGDNAEMPDLKLREGLVLAPLLALIVFMGVYPKPVIERMEPAVDALVAHIEEHVDGFHEPTSRFGVDIEGAGDHGSDHADEGDDH